MKLRLEPEVVLLPGYSYINLCSIQLAKRMSLGLRTSSIYFSDRAALFTLSNAHVSRQPFVYLQADKINWVSGFNYCHAVIRMLGPVWYACLDA